MRSCLACGYDLSGHGEEPRCPECGLLNIPEGYRRQVWELVDSGKWLFSGPFSFFRKRPPGWWWALDRPDDIRRAIGAATRNRCIAALLVMIALVLGTAIVVEGTTRYLVYDIGDPSGTPVYQGDSVFYSGLYPNESLRGQEANPSDIYSSSRTFTTTTTSRVIFIPNWRVLSFSPLFIFWVMLTWAAPMFVGLITQLRKGLPSFARPPVTIIAAGLYETYRTIYVSGVLALCCGALVFSMIADIWLVLILLFFPNFVIPPLAIVFAGLGWIGPLRSDYTKQLIRSRFHAGRIILMYAFLFPLLLVWTIVALIIVLANDL